MPRPQLKTVYPSAVLSKRWIGQESLFSMLGSVNWNKQKDFFSQMQRRLNKQHLSPTEWWFHITHYRCLYLLDGTYYRSYSEYSSICFGLLHPGWSLWRWYTGACWFTCDPVLPSNSFHRREVVFGPVCSPHCAGSECRNFLSVERLVVSLGPSAHTLWVRKMGCYKQKLEVASLMCLNTSESVMQVQE